MTDRALLGEPIVVLVCGEGAFDDKLLLDRALDCITLARKIIRVVHGCSTGAGRLANIWAFRNGVACTCYPPWAYFGRSAETIRNQEMLDNERPDIVIAFPGGDGTADLCRRAQRAQVPVCQVTGFDDIAPLVNQVLGIPWSAARTSVHLK